MWLPCIFSCLMRTLSFPPLQWAWEVLAHLACGHCGCGMFCHQFPWQADPPPPNSFAAFLVPAFLLEACFPLEGKWRGYGIIFRNFIEFSPEILRSKYFIATQYRLTISFFQDIGQSLMRKLSEAMISIAVLDYLGTFWTPLVSSFSFTSALSSSILYQSQLECGLGSSLSLFLYLPVFMVVSPFTWLSTWSLSLFHFLLANFLLSPSLFYFYPFILFLLKSTKVSKSIIWEVCLLTASEVWKKGDLGKNSKYLSPD